MFLLHETKNFQSLLRLFVKAQKNKETLSLFVLGVRNVIAKKAGQRFEVDIVQKMLIPKIAIKYKLQ